jgi:hypothetical protein
VITHDTHIYSTEYNCYSNSQHCFFISCTIHPFFLQTLDLLLTTSTSPSPSFTLSTLNTPTHLYFLLSVSKFFFFFLQILPLLPPPLSTSASYWSSLSSFPSSSADSLFILPFSSSPLLLLFTHYPSVHLSVQTIDSNTSTATALSKTDRTLLNPNGRPHL